MEKQFDNASNLQELEYCVRVLGSGGLSNLEKIVCQSVLAILMECTRSERMSEVWNRECQNHCQDILDVFEDVSQWGGMSEDDKNFMLWAGLDIAGMMMPPKHEWPRDGERGDKRLEVALRVVREYGRYGRGWTWEQTENAVVKFFWTDGCKASWENAWLWAERQLDEERQLT